MNFIFDLDKVIALVIHQQELSRWKLFIRRNYESSSLFLFKQCDSYAMALSI